MSPSCKSLQTRPDFSKEIAHTKAWNKFLLRTSRATRSEPLRVEAAPHPLPDLARHMVNL